MLYRGKVIKEHEGPMDKAKGGRFKGGRWGWVGWRAMVGEKWRHLFLNDNNNKKTMH